MLPNGDPLELAQLLQTLPCRVAIPDWYRELIGQRGPVAGRPDDRRRFTRYTYAAKAILECHGNLPALARTSERHLVLCTNLSRNGIAFLHAESLYPGEEISLWLPTGRSIYVVRRCRRHLEHCYEIGTERAAATAAKAAERVESRE